MIEALDKVVTWRGRRIEDLSREEFEAAFQQLAQMWKNAMDAHARTLEVWESARKARR